MLRVMKNGSSSTGAPVAANLYHDFSDPYLELLRLLHNAAALEHMLMLQYLYAAFSIKERYKAVRGELTPDLYLDTSSSSLLGVAVQEMQHLHLVNQFLVALGAAPNLAPQEFPFTSEVYPFALTLEPLSLDTVAAYLYVEADDCALNLECGGHTQEEQAYIREVLQRVPNADRNEIGSLYHSIIRVSRSVAAHPPTSLSPDLDWNKFDNSLLTIIAQGELQHYRFFRQVFQATHPGFRGLPVWNYPPDATEYPSVIFDSTQTTAYEGKKNEIRDPSLRAVAWLSDLHYWIILGLLDTSYRFNRRSLRFNAVAGMTGALYQLGIYLAGHALGVPLDPPPLDNDLGLGEAESRRILEALVQEAATAAFRLRSELPPSFEFGVYRETIQGLGS